MKRFPFFHSILCQSKTYHAFFDVKLQLWACYAICARVVDKGVDRIISAG